LPRDASWEPTQSHVIQAGLDHAVVGIPSWIRSHETGRPTLVGTGMTRPEAMNTVKADLQPSQASHAAPDITHAAFLPS
jgi:hypothetical protein